jgi:anaerobic magnesium-protoporphyrin IX monomethyl ester cyclase
MKVQLVHPPLYLNVHAMTALRPSLPLGLAYVAAALREAGHEVSLVDAVALAPEQVTRSSMKKQLFALGLTVEQIVERLDPQADVFGVTNMWTFSWPLVRELLVQMKARFPNTPIVCGGEHFSGLRSSRCSRRRSTSSSAAKARRAPSR